MRKLKKLKIPIFFFLALALFLLPSINALTINNTTFSTSISNYTIHVDLMELDEVNVTNYTISFYNVTSVGSNLTNINATYNARADFYGLDIGLTIRNINTSTDLFTSESGNQDYNATFTSGQVIRIMSDVTEEETTTCSLLTRTSLRLTVGFFALGILGIVLILIYKREEIDIKLLLIIFISIILGVVFIQVIANSVTSLCG